MFFLSYFLLFPSVQGVYAKQD